MNYQETDDMHGELSWGKEGCLRMHRMPKRLLLILVIALLEMNSALSWGGELDKAQAKAHFETVTLYYDVQEYEKAFLEYKAAYLAKPDPACLFNIGQCYRKLGKDQRQAGPRADRRPIGAVVTAVLLSSGKESKLPPTSLGSQGAF